MQHLFVYGTLMSGSGHPMAARLGRESRLLGPARIRGRLYSLGWYPALVETGPDDGDVHGEVYALTSPEASFRWLDAYEGIVRGQEDRSDYARVERPVLMAAGHEMKAWVYLYRAPIKGAPAIDSGRWVTATS